MVSVTPTPWPWSWSAPEVLLFSPSFSISPALRFLPTMGDDWVVSSWSDSPGVSGIFGGYGSAADAVDAIGNNDEYA